MSKQYIVEFDGNEELASIGTIQYTVIDNTVRAVASVQSEIIRCKNCAKRNDMGYCTKFQNNIHGIATSWYAPDDDDFCSRAERRTDE